MVAKMMYMTPTSSLGASIAAQATCPPCSYLWEGSCRVCETDDPHPGCEGCIDGVPRPSPWYKSDLFLAVASAVTVSVISAIIVTRIQQRFQ
jgi:hypothetical protein